MLDSGCRPRAAGALATRGRVSMAPCHSVPEGPMPNDAPKRVGILRDGCLGNIDQEMTITSYSWALTLISKILARVVLEGTVREQIGGVQVRTPYVDPISINPLYEQGVVFGPSESGLIPTTSHPMDTPQEINRLVDE